MSDYKFIQIDDPESGIRRISRFPLDSLRTTIAGTVDHVYKDYMPPATLSERIALLAGEEAISQSGIGSKGHFPGPLFLALPPLEIEWPYRMQMAEQAIPGGDAGYPDLMRVAREPQFAPIYETLKYGIIGEHLADYFGTEGSPISLTTAAKSLWCTVYTRCPPPMPMPPNSFCRSLRMMQ